MLAALPFWHAAVRLRSRRVRLLALAYTAADIYLVGLTYLLPQGPDGTPENDTLTAICGLSAVLITVAAVVQLRTLRREIYGDGVVPAP